MQANRDKVRAWISGFIGVAVLGGAARAELPPMELQWDLSFGGDTNEVLKTVLALPDGGLLLGGESSSEPSGNKEAEHFGAPGVADIWLVRLDGAGKKLWDHSYGGDAAETLSRVCAMADGGYLVCGTSRSEPSGNKTIPLTGAEDLWVVRLDADGNVLWDQAHGRLGDGYSRNWMVTEQTADGGLIVASGVVKYGSNIWVVRLDKEGKKVWDKIYGGTGKDEVKQIVVLPDGGSLLCAQSWSPKSGNKTVPFYGGFIVGDVWLIRLDADGNKVWEQELGGSNEEYYRSIVPLADGGFMVGMYSQSTMSGTHTAPGFGDRDYWVVRIDASGRILWDETYGGGYTDVLSQTLVGIDSPVVLGGMSGSVAENNKTAPLVGQGDAWFLGIRLDGGIEWQETIGVTNATTRPMAYPTAQGRWLLGLLVTVSTGALGVYEHSFGLMSTDQRMRELGESFVWKRMDRSGFGFSLQGRTMDGGFYAGWSDSVTVTNTDYRVFKVGPKPIAAQPEGVRLMTWTALQGRIENEGFLVGLVGAKDTSYIVESSTNLVDWIPWQTNTMGDFDIRRTDLTATNSSQRFYRARQQ